MMESRPKDDVCWGHKWLCAGVLCLMNLFPGLVAVSTVPTISDGSVCTFNVSYAVSAVAYRSVSQKQKMCSGWWLWKKCSYRTVYQLQMYPIYVMKVKEVSMLCNSTHIPTFIPPTYPTENYTNETMTETHATIGDDMSFGGGPSPGQIAGVVIGALVLLAVCLLVLFFLIRRKRLRRKKKKEQSTSQVEQNQPSTADAYYVPPDAVRERKRKNKPKHDRSEGNSIELTNQNGFQAAAGSRDQSDMSYDNLNHDRNKQYDSDDKIYQNQGIRDTYDHTVVKSSEGKIYENDGEHSAYEHSANSLDQYDNLETSHDSVTGKSRQVPAGYDQVTLC